MGTLRTKLSHQPWILALALSLLLVLWMSSGQAEQVKTKEAVKKLIQKVQVDTFIAENVAKTMTLYGRSEPDRQATLAAEISGKIIDVFAKRGSVVKKDQPIARLAINDIETRLASSKALVQQREMEYRGLKTLSEKGLQDESRLASANANLAAAKANVTALEIALNNTLIVAPFDGILNERFVEVGDYVKDGDRVAQVVDLNPLIVRGQASEMDVSELTEGQVATAKFVNGLTVEGQVRYIASLADKNTNTFEIEVAIDNSQGLWKAGASAQLDIALTQQSAIKVTPAVLALDESGSIGVKSVKNNRVVFNKIDIIRSDEDGVWLAGLGDKVDIIILGQGYVRAGDEVQVSNKANTQVKAN